MRRSSSLFFIPLEPYPARFARHLPHAGKALSVVILFLYVSCIRFDDARKAASLYHSLPLEGAAERSEAGLASFLGGEAASSLPSPLGKALCREKRHPRITAFPLGEGGPRQRRSGALVNDALETIFFALFHPARTLSGSLCSPPSPRGEGVVRRYSFSLRILYSL